MKKSMKVVVPMVLAAAGASDPVQADDLFLNFNGEIQGESTDQYHKNEIDVLSWSWNMSQEYDSLGRPTLATVRDIKINKYTDKATSQLALRLLEGKTLAEANLIVRNPGTKSPIEYIKIKMTNVNVTKLAQGSDVATLRATETVALSFAQVCITYTPTLADGSPGASSTTCWDVQAGGKI